jgi:hypothetical protein
MPVDFLTDEQARRYGRYNADPTPTQLSRYFYLDDRDRQEIRRGDYNRLGYAIQLCTVRFLGTFLPEPTAAPRVVIAHVAKQLAIEEPSYLTRYRERVETHHAHATQIQRRHGYRDFHQQPVHFRLVRWLYTRAWVSAERPITLFDLTTARLVKQKILLPGVTTLTRLVASVRDRAAARLWRILAQLPSPLQRGRLLSLLQLAEAATAILFWTGCVAHQPELARLGCWTHSTGFRSSARYGWRILICLGCLLGGSGHWLGMLRFRKPRRSNGCRTSVKLQLSWHLPGPMNRLLKTMLWISCINSLARSYFAPSMQANVNDCEAYQI